MKKASILLIDDDPLFLSLTRKKLKETPHLEKINCITHVKDAREFLDACLAKGKPGPDLVFLDINMPGIGGLDFAELYSRRFSGQFPDTKLVILTSSNSRKDKEKALAIQGVDEFVVKPLTEEKLSKLLQ